MDLTATELDYLYVVIAADKPLRLADLADQMRTFQSGVEDRLGARFAFDWKEAVEDGRE